MKSICVVFLLLLCTGSLISASNNIELEGSGSLDDPSERVESTLVRRSVDADSNHEYGARCISCGKLGGSYSASASAAASASASASGGASEGSDSSYSIPPSTYGSTYNTYPSHSSYSQSRKSSSYGTRGGNVPTGYYGGSGDQSSSSYSSSSQYSSEPQYRSSLPASSSGRNSDSSYYFSQTGSSYANPSSYDQSSTYSQSNTNARQNPYGDHSFDEQIARMREEMNQGNYFSSQYPTYQNGGSHRSEYSSESRHVNGKPVYEKKTEKRYKDGQIVHDSHIEKGPEELGTSDAMLSEHQPSPYQSSHSYSSQFGESNGNSFTPSSADGYPGHPREYRPVSKESHYSEMRSSSHQPVFSTNRHIPSSSFSHDQNARPYNYPTARIPYRAPVSTKVVESSYEESNFGSRRPKYYAPISNTVTNEETINVASASTSTNPNTSDGPIAPDFGEPTFVQDSNESEDTSEEPIAQNFAHDNNELEYPSIPSNTKNPTAYQSSRTSYNKETRYSSGMDNGYSNAASADASPIRQPYTEATSRSSKDRYQDSRRHQLPNSNNQRYDVSPYHDSQQTRDQINSYDSRPENRHIRPEVRPIIPEDRSDDKLIRPEGRPTIPKYRPIRTEDRPTTNVNNYEGRTIQGIQTTNTNNYVPRPAQGIKTTNVSQSSQYYRNYKPQYYSGAEPDTANNYNDMKYTQDQTRFNSMNYRKPSYTRLPSRWMEVKTTYKYRNGKLIGESRLNKVFEDGILISQNTTERTREQMANEGIDVVNLDLKFVTVQQPATLKSSEEVRYIKESSANQPLSRRLNPYPYSPERNTVENSYMESKASYHSGNDRNLPEHMRANDLSTREYSGSRMFTHHQPVIQPETSEQRHEIFEEEEFINGEKVYDLHHERKFKDNSLVYDNKTELLPKDLGVKAANKTSSYFTRQNSNSRRFPMSREGMFAQNSLRTSCLSCSTGGQHSLNLFNRTEGLQTVSSHAPLAAAVFVSGAGAQPGYSGTTQRKDVDIEERYENGRLVRGKEINKKWIDGRLVDSKSETYDQGPSRTKQITVGSGSLSATDHRSTSTRPSSRTDSCQVNPCQNGATCRTTASNKNICLCKFGFKGDFCQTAYCPVRFCRYGGACSITNDHHLCICQEGFTGHRCKTRVQKISIAPSSY